MLDPTLGYAITKELHEQDDSGKSVVRKDLLFKDIPKMVTEYHMITDLRNKEVQLKAGALAPIQITAFKHRNKKVTTICHFDVFKIDPKTIAKTIRKDIHVGVTSQVDASGNNYVQVQGEHIDKAKEHMMLTFGVHPKYLKCQDQTKGKKKGGKK